MPIVKVGDQRIKFPDDMSQEDIGAVLQKQFSQPEPEQQPPQQDPLAGMYEQPQAQTGRPQITGGRGISGQRTQRAKFDEQQALDQYKQIESGQLSAADMPTEQVEAIRKARINSIPELSGLGANVDFGSALAGLTAFNPEEMGAIISKSDPNIGIVTTPDGETLAVNNKTGAAVNLNKAGPSITDALQMGAAAAAFTPAGKAASIPGMIAAGMGTQALIETGQEVAGGEFNLGDVALAGAAPVIMKGIGAGAKKTFKYIRPKTTQNFIDDAVKPIEQQKAQALEKAKNQEILWQAPKKRAEIRQAIEEGTIEGVGYKVNKAGKVVKDPVQRSLVRAGIDTDTIGTVNRMTLGDKVATGKMIDKYQRIIRNVKGSENERPAGVIGESAMKRFNTIKDYQMDASKQISQAVRRDLAGKKVNIQGQVDDFMDDLADLGIEVGEDGALDFSESVLTGNKTALKEAWRMIQKGEYDGRRLHQTKQALQKLVYSAKRQEASEGVLDAQAQGAIERLSGKINKSLRDLSGDYAEGNKKFASAAEAIKPFTKGMTKRFDPEFDQIDEFVGQELRKTLSNYGKASELRSSINKMDKFARSIDGVYDDDIMNLVQFNTALESLGTVAPNSAQGTIERAGKVVASGVGGGQPAELASIGLNAAKNRFVFTKPKEETLKILNDMRKLISQ